MKGTEKQIAWATEIQKTVINVMDAASAMIRTYPDSPTKTANLDGIAARRQLVVDAEYAGDIISLFKDIKQTGDTPSDLRKLLSVYHITAPETTGQRKILMK